MQPHSHAFVIRAAVRASGSAWLVRRESEILRGNTAEDDFVWLGLRLRAPGLTHTYRPGSRFGELGAPSALAQLERWLARARRAERAEAAAFWLGRACHLLGDMAVPARTRGVWHLFGDPLEAYWEAHVSELPLLLGAAAELGAPSASPTEHAEMLARASSAWPADTTRTPWGAWQFRARGIGQQLDAVAIEQQARVLLQSAVQHTRGFLLSALPSLSSANKKTPEAAKAPGVFVSGRNA